MRIENVTLEDLTRLDTKNLALLYSKLSTLENPSETQCDLILAVLERAESDELLSVYLWLIDEVIWTMLKLDD